MPVNYRHENVQAVIYTMMDTWKLMLILATGVLDLASGKEYGMLASLVDP